MRLTGAEKRRQERKLRPTVTFLPRLPILCTRLVISDTESVAALAYFPSCETLALPSRGMFRARD